MVQPGKDEVNALAQAVGKTTGGKFHGEGHSHKKHGKNGQTVLERKRNARLTTRKVRDGKGDKVSEPSREEGRGQKEEKRLRKTPRTSTNEP